MGPPQHWKGEDVTTFLARLQLSPIELCDRHMILSVPDFPTMRNHAALLAVTAFVIQGSAAQQDRAEACDLHYSTTTVPGNFSHWAVSSEASQCDAVPRNIQQKGGNIADAAVATLLCMGVVLPHFMGIGGGFMATYYSRKEKRAFSLIAREVAPAAATRDMFVENSTLSTMGGLSIAVPGELRGYAELHKRLEGKLPWKELFEDAVHLARQGFPVGHFIPYSLCYEAPYLFSCPDGPCDPRWKPFWNYQEMRPLKEGELLVQSDLASTLEAIAENGPDYFYEGVLAEETVREISKQGAILTVDDLRSYWPTWVPAINVTLQDGRVLHTVPPPGGGAVYANIMAIMDAFRNNASALLEDNVLTLHRFIEACKFAYASRSQLGDPLYVNVEDVVRYLTSWDCANVTRWQIDDDRTYHDPAHYGMVTQSPPPDHGTAHLSLWGASGDVLSVTTTINGYYGSLIRTASGVIFNNEMDDFSTPGDANFWGLPPSPANYIEPGKRPQSSMSPTVVVDQNGEVEMVLGGTGGSKIITSVALVSMWNMMQGIDIKNAMDSPRLHEQLIPDAVQVEPQFPESYARQLEGKGHTIEVVHGEFSTVMAVRRARDSLHAYADYRSDGGVAGG